MRTRILGDRAFYTDLWRLAMPLAIQQLILNALNAVDVLMVGQLGDTAVAAVGLANQIWFLLSLFLFGVGSGSVIFAAQFWGRRDVPNVRRSLALALLLGIAGGVLFTTAALAIPGTLLRFYSEDPAVVALGSRYLRVVSLSYLPSAISVIYGMILRSTHHVRTPTAISVGALSLKTILAYGFIFGNFGFPALGPVGGAVATVIARCLECVALLTLTYARDWPAAARIADFFHIGRPLLGQFVHTALPVVLGEILWSLGFTTYSAVYAHIGTESVAAVNIASTIEQVALVPFLSLTGASAVILGNAIGGGRIALATEYARRYLALTIGGALLIGALTYVVSDAILQLYRISQASRQDAEGVLIVLSCVLWVKAADVVIIAGILRSGGDTRFALFADILPLWLIGVPVALFSAFVLHLPVYWVVLLITADELTKFVLGTWRVLSGYWIHNVVQAI